MPVLLIKAFSGINRIKFHNLHQRVQDQARCHEEQPEDERSHAPDEGNGMERAAGKVFGNGVDDGNTTNDGQGDARHAE